MRLLADMHISPRTIHFLGTLGHDVLRIDSVLPRTATDEEIVTLAIREDRTVLTQDLGFSAIVALTGKTRPSLISLRLSSGRIEHVNRILQKILPAVEQDVKDGAIVTVEDQRIRSRPLPIA